MNQGPPGGHNPIEGKDSFEKKLSLEQIKESMVSIISSTEYIIDKEYIIEKQLEDGKGVYLFEVSLVDSDGDRVEYMYRREGEYLEFKTAETSIEEVRYMGDIPVGGTTKARFSNDLWMQCT